MNMLCLIGAAIIGIASILHIVALATTHWYESEILTKVNMYHKISGNSGLFKMCNQDNCGDIKKPSSSLEAVRAFCILGLLLAFGTIALIVLTQVLKALQEKRILPFLWLLASFGAFASIILAVIIYGAKTYQVEKERYETLQLVQNIEYDINLGYSFYLPIFAALGMAGGGLVAFMGPRMASRSTS